MTDRLQHIDENTSALYVDGILVAVGNPHMVDQKITEIFSTDEINSETFCEGPEATGSNPAD